MPEPQPHIHEAPTNVYAVVYKALLWGMILSSALFALGMVLALDRHTVISLGAMKAVSWSQFWRGLLHLDPTALMQLATVVLILTPVSRVFLAFVTFWVDHDRKFVLVCGTVLGVIVLTVILGRLGLH
ncbi:MAG: DUF1634 domain-containing protein [Terriglobales bacterium]